MDLKLFDRYQYASNLTTTAVQRINPCYEIAKIEYPSDVLKLDMIEFFKPQNKKEKGLLFGAFSKYHHGKIQDAFLTCQKGFTRSGEMKYKSLLYLIGIIRKLK